MFCKMKVKHFIQPVAQSLLPYTCYRRESNKSGEKLNRMHFNWESQFRCSKNYTRQQSWTGQRLELHETVIFNQIQLYKYQSKNGRSDSFKEMIQTNENSIIMIVCFDSLFLIFFFLVLFYQTRLQFAFYYYYKMIYFSGFKCGVNIMRSAFITNEIFLG